MAASAPVVICNQALSWLGATRIIELGEDTPEGRLCNENYDPLRESVLEEYEWSFAVRRTTISAPLDDDEETRDAYDGMNRFLLADEEGVIRILQVANNPKFHEADSTEWYMEQNYIITNLEKVYVRYIFSLVDTNKFSSNFVQALAARIAVDLALPITESTERATAMYQLYVQKLQIAQNTDGIQGRTRRVRSTWMKHSRSRTSGVAV